MIPQKHKAPSRSLFLLFAMAVGASFLVESRLQAQLQWETTTIRESIELDQERSEAVFRFENTGSYPIVIRSTNSSCGCTTAELERSTYYPGDTGEIKAQFEVGNRTGTRRNTIQVRTNDPMEPVSTLTYEVSIPTLVTISPRLVHWRMGDEPEPKRIRIELNPEANLKVTGVELDNDDFEVVLTEGENPHEYQLDLTPLQTKSRGRAIISLQTDPKMENQRNFSFYAYVR